jgi:hypothetical protein
MTISIYNFSGLKITFSKTKNYRNTLICKKKGNEKLLAGLNNEEAIAAQVENNLHHIFSSRHCVFALLHPS